VLSEKKKGSIKCGTSERRNLRKGPRARTGDQTKASEVREDHQSGKVKEEKALLGG